MDGADFEDPSLLSLVPQPGEEMMVRNNMVANLPLLFAGGYPTTLGKITETQLEQFIPFMVQCSLGCIQINGEFEYSEPEWWPDYVPFVIPLRRPASIAPGDWHKKLREIVVICYSFHKVVYLLRFCDDLSVYTKESLRFINNKNTTTSMLERVTNKLLVTFRNENMLYDQQLYTKKTLMPRHAMRPLDVGLNGEGSTEEHDEIDYQFIDSAPFDIILCEFCDAELYSEQAYRDHERICSMDDDVIFCGTATLSDIKGAAAATSTAADTKAALQLSQSPLSACAKHESVTPAETLATERLAYQAHFLHHFGLGNAAVPIDRPAAPFITDAITKSPSKQSPSGGSGSKLRRWPRRGRAVLGLAKCPTIPISSPAGQRMVRTAKSLVTAEYLSERLERVERSCPAPMLGQHRAHQHQHNSRKSAMNSISTHPYLVASSEAAAAATGTTPITYRRPAPGDCRSTHQYTFPRRQFRRMTRVQRFRLLNVSEMRQCVPMTIPLPKLTDSQIEQLRRRPHRTNFQLEQMRRRRERQAMRRWRRLDQQQQSASADATLIIDLCSDDEADVDPNTNGAQSNGADTVNAPLRQPPPLLRFDDLYQRVPFEDPFAYILEPMTLVSVDAVDAGETMDALLQCNDHSNTSDISITRNRRHGKQQQQQQQNHHPHHQPQPSSNESTPTTTTLSLLNDLTACTSPSSSSSTSSAASHDSLSVPPSAMPALVRRRPPIVESGDSDTARSVKRARFRHGSQASEHLQQQQQRRRLSTTSNGERQHPQQNGTADVSAAAAAAAATAHQQESVSIYSRATHTAMTLANHRQLMYDHGNQENQRFAANAAATSTTTTTTTSPPVQQQPMQPHLTSISGSAGIVPIGDPSSPCLMAFELPTSVTLTAAATASHSAAGKHMPLVSQPEIVIERIPSVLHQQQLHHQQQQPYISIDLTLT